MDVPCTSSLVEGMSDNDYHKQLGPEEHYYSSSQFKDMIKDPEIFHKKYITQEIVGKDSPAFGIGRAFHGKILEPQHFDRDFVVYTKKRQGAEWKKFQEKHEGLTILTVKEMETAMSLVDNYEASPLAVDIVSQEGAQYELSLFHELMGIRCKARYDIINLGKDISYIADLKSTSGNPKDEFAMKNTISSFSYDLSAAFYTDLINDYIKKHLPGIALVKEFSLIFSSKSLPICKTWVLDEHSLAVGRAKYEKALRDIKKYQALNWEFFDEIGYISPLPWEKDEWLKDKKTGTKTKNKHADTTRSNTTSKTDLF